MKRFLRLKFRDFVLWFLRKVSQREIVRLLVNGDYQVLSGDLVIFEAGDFIELGQAVAQINEYGSNVVQIRIFRRPK